MGAEFYSPDFELSQTFVVGKIIWKPRHPMKVKTRSLQRFRATRNHSNQWLSPAEIERKVIEIGLQNQWFPLRKRLWTGSAY